MTDTVKAVINPGHRLIHINQEGAEVASTEDSGIVVLSKADFETAEKAGAARKATAEDKDAEAQIARGGQAPAQPSVEEQRAAAAAETLLDNDGKTDQKSGGRR